MATIFCATLLKLLVGIMFPVNCRHCPDELQVVGSKIIPFCSGTVAPTLFCTVTGVEKVPLLPSAVPQSPMLLLAGSVHWALPSSSLKSPPSILVVGTVVPELKPPNVKSVCV